MVVIASPLRLKLAVVTLFMSVPLVATEVIIATRSPWWNLPLRGMGYWSLAYFLLCFPIGLWILAGRRWAYSLLRVLLAVWLFASVSLAIKSRLPALGFFSLFLAMLTWLELTWLKRELGRSFLDPKIFWFQGLPRPISGLKCKIAGAESLLDLDVSRLDQDGAFVYVPYPKQKGPLPFKGLHRRKKFQLEFSYRDQKLVCAGNPVMHLNSGAGAGFQFADPGADSSKEIGSFVELLRAEGHAEWS